GCPCDKQLLTTRTHSPAPPFFDQKKADSPPLEVGRIHTGLAAERGRQSSRLSACNLGCALACLLPVSRKVRHYADQSFDSAQLCAVVHFVFFGSLQHLEAGFGCAAGYSYLLGQD